MGAGSKIPEAVGAALEQRFGNVGAWRREFVALARALDGGPGWVLLTYSHRERGVRNQIAVDHSQGMPDATPLLALDMYEHAYRLDCGANAPAYISAFMRNIDWTAVDRRLLAARTGGDARDDAADDSLPSVSVEELRAKMEAGEPNQVLDARAPHNFTRGSDMMRGAMWRDPNAVAEWSKDLRADSPVFVYCSYGYAVGCGVAAALRERGFDATFIRGGLSAWFAAGGARDLITEHEHYNGGVGR